MSEEKEPEIVWTGLVPTTSGRVSRRTGRRLEYRVKLFADGSVSCSCQGFLINQTRCKHTTTAERAVRAGAGDVPAPPRPRAPADGGPAKGATPAPTSDGDDFLDEFQDDALLGLPQVRHERRD